MSYYSPGRIILYTTLVIVVLVIVGLITYFGTRLLS